MKKSILLMLPLALTIGSCSCSSNLDKGSIFNENFMSNNFGNEWAEPTYEETVMKKTDLALGENIATVNVSAADGVLSVVDSEGKEGLFSLALKQYVVPLGSHELVDIANAGGDIEYYYYVDKTPDEKFVLTGVDFKGEQVYQTEVADAATGGLIADVERIAYTDRAEKEVLLAHLYDAANPVGKYFIYNDDLSVKESGDYYEYAASHRFEKLYREYGHRELGRVISTAGRYSFYSTKDKKYVSSFYFDAAAYKYTAGDWMVFQRAIELEERATEYDYYSNAKKYDLETYRINYTTGAREDIETKISILTHQPQLDTKELFDDSKDNKVKRYFYQEDCYLINENKTIEPIQRSLILNDKFEQVADVSDIGFGDLTKWGNCYYAPDGFVYDANLHEVAYIEDLEDAEADNHIVEVNAFYGLVNTKGESLLAPTAFNAKRVATIEKADIYVLEAKESLDLYKIDEKEALTKIASFSKETYKDIKNADTILTYGVITDVDDKDHLLNFATGEVTDIVMPEDTFVLSTEAQLNYKSIDLSAAVFKTESGYYMIENSVTYNKKLA